MLSRNFRIIQRDVRAFATKHDTRLCERVAVAFRRSRLNAENNLRFFGKPQSGIGRWQIQIRTRGVCPCKRGKWRHNHGGIYTALDLHNGGLTTIRAFELYFRMAAELPIFQHVLRATVNARRLHTLKLAPFEALWRTPDIFRAQR